MALSKTLTSDFEDLTQIAEKTMPEYLLAKAKYYSELRSGPWLMDSVTGETRGFGNFDKETKQIASALYALGLRKGDCVIYTIRDLCKVPILFTGVWRANGILRTSYPEDSEEVIISRVNEHNVKFIVCEEDGVEKCKNIAKNVNGELHIVTVHRSHLTSHSIQQFLEENDGSGCPEFSLSENDNAIILSTSGTTGIPKGAVHTHKSFLYVVRTLGRLPFTLHKPNVISTKATHISGSTFSLSLLETGKTGIFVSELTMENFITAVVKYKPGLLFGFPTLLVALAGPIAKKYDFSSLETLMTGGMPVTPAMKETMRQGLPTVQDIVVGYGLTEIMSALTNAVLVSDEQRKTATIRDIPDSSIGKPSPGVEAQFRNPETLEILGPYVHGELCVKSVGVFSHYHMNKEATENSFVDGYLRTGDIGYYDSNGYAYVVDRLKDIFKYYGDHISPTELENVISKHPKVIEACVIGVADPGGHIPRAYITVHPDAGSKNDVIEEIKNYANENLASYEYKQLRGGVVIVDELPKGKTGKISRQLVEKLEI